MLSSAFQKYIYYVTKGNTHREINKKLYKIYLCFMLTVLLISTLFACLARFFFFFCVCQIGREISGIVSSHFVAVGDQSFHICMLVRYGMA